LRPKSNPKPKILNQELKTVTPEPQQTQTLDPLSLTPNPYTLNPESYTLNP